MFSLLWRLVPTGLALALTRAPSCCGVPRASAQSPTALQMDRGQDAAPPRSPQTGPPCSSQDPLHTHPRNEKRERGNGGRGGKEQRGAAALPPLWAPLQLPVSKSDIYWEINTPWGSSFKPPRKHNGGGDSCGLGHRTKTPDLSWRQDGIPWEQRPRRTLVPFDFKGKS